MQIRDKKQIKIEASCKDFKLSKTGTLISIKTNMYKAAKMNWSAEACDLSLSLNDH